MGYRRGGDSNRAFTTHFSTRGHVCLLRRRHAEKTARRPLMLHRWSAATRRAGGSMKASRVGERVPFLEHRQRWRFTLRRITDPLCLSERVSSSLFERKILRVCLRDSCKTRTGRRPGISVARRYGSHQNHLCFLSAASP